MNKKKTRIRLGLSSDFFSPNCVKYVNDSVATEAERAQQAEADLQSSLETTALNLIQRIHNETERAQTAEDGLNTALENHMQSADDMSNALGDGRFEVAKAYEARTVVDGAISKEKLDGPLQVSVSVVDNLETNNTLMPLSANQGKVLNEKIEAETQRAQIAESEIQSELAKKPGTKIANKGEVFNASNNRANGSYSHAEGYGTNAAGLADHTEGRETTATGGQGSHAEGWGSETSGNASHVEGYFTQAKNYGEHAEGRCNYSIGGDDTPTIHTVGVGTRNTATGAITRKNAHAITRDGKHYLLGVGGYEGREVSGCKDLASVIAEKGGTNVEWNSTDPAYGGDHMDNYTQDGVYNIKGYSAYSDGLPITTGSYFAAQLTVLNFEQGAMQHLTLGFDSGSETKTYNRYYDKSAGKWSPWQTLQGNQEVGQVTSLDGFINNGIYSGVYTDGRSFFDTFTLIVINNYAVAGATGNTRSVTQLLYSVGVDGVAKIRRRIGSGNNIIAWGQWYDADEKLNGISMSLRELIESEAQRAQTEEISIRTDLTLTLSTKPNGNIVIGNLAGQGKEFMPATPSGDPLHYAYEAWGAVYNDTEEDIVRSFNVQNVKNGFKVVHKAKHWYMPGLGDLTNKDMQNISATPRNGRYPGAYINYNNIRYAKIQGHSMSVGAPDCKELFRWCGKLEIVYADGPSLGLGSPAYAFAGCNKLRTIYGALILEAGSEVFLHCHLLEDVYLYILNRSVSFQDSPKLSKDSILYAINKERTSTAITITLHPDTYAWASVDEDIVAALAQHDKISLVSA